MQTGGELLALRGRTPELSLRPFDARKSFGTGTLVRLRKHVLQRREPPRRALVEALLQPTSFLVARHDEASTRILQLGDLRTDFRLQPRIRSSEPRRRRDRFDERRIVEHGAVVHERRELLSIALQPRDAPIGTGWREVERTARGVDIDSFVLQPVANLDCRIAERAGERVPQRPRPRLTELDIEIDHRRALPR